MKGYLYFNENWEADQDHFLIGNYYGMEVKVDNAPCWQIRPNPLAKWKYQTYKIGETYEFEGEVNNKCGFIVYENLPDLFRFSHYYKKNSHVVEVEASGRIFESKFYKRYSKITLIRELDTNEILRICEDMGDEDMVVEIKEEIGYKEPEYVPGDEDCVEIGNRIIKRGDIRKVLNYTRKKVYHLSDRPSSEIFSFGDLDFLMVIEPQLCMTPSNPIAGFIFPLLDNFLCFEDPEWLVITPRTVYSKIPGERVIYFRKDVDLVFNKFKELAERYKNPKEENK